MRNENISCYIDGPSVPFYGEKIVKIEGGVLDVEGDLSFRAPNINLNSIQIISTGTISFFGDSVAVTNGKIQAPIVSGRVKELILINSTLEATDEMRLEVDKLDLNYDYPDDSSESCESVKYEKPQNSQLCFGLFSGPECGMSDVDSGVHVKMTM